VYLIAGLERAQKIKLKHALWIGSIAAIAYQGVFMIFNG
jgi:hypothetical protein